MIQKLPPFHTWEFFQACAEAVGEARVREIFQVSYSELRRWCRNPEFTSDSARNPLDRLELLVRLLATYGQREAAEAAVRRLSRVLDMDIAKIEPCEPDHDSIEKELLDIPPAVVEHARACMEGCLEAVTAWEIRAIEEIRQASAKANEQADPRAE